MISIFIFKNKDSKIVGFKSTGHAEYDEYGKDIICAAVSILTINTINSIEKLTNSKFSLEEDEKKGILKFNLSNEPTQETELLLKSLVLGLIGISKEYEDEYIHIIFKEV